MKTRLPVHGLVPIAFQLDPNVTFADMKVYTALASFQGSNDDAFPSRDKIVERCGLALETVSRSVTHLVEMGWIQRDRRGLNQTNVYRVMIEAMEILGSDSQVISKNDPQVTSKMTPRSLPSIGQKQQRKPQNKILSLFDEQGVPIQKTEPQVLATLLLTEHRKHDPGFNAGKDDEDKIQKWAIDIDKIIRIDKRPADDVRMVIQFSQESPFWAANIVSGSKLRLQFDRLLVQAKNQGYKPKGEPEPLSTPMTDREKLFLEVAKRG